MPPPCASSSCAGNHRGSTIRPIVPDTDDEPLRCVMKNRPSSLVAGLTTGKPLPTPCSAPAYRHTGLTSRRSAEGKKRGGGVFGTLRPASFRGHRGKDLASPATQLPSSLAHGWQFPYAAHLCPYKGPAGWPGPDKTSTTDSCWASWTSHLEAIPLLGRITAHFSYLPAATLPEPVA